MGEFYPIYSVNEARRLFGAGSVAVQMAIQHFCTCPDIPLYIAPVDEPTGGVAAVHTITIAGPATDHGVLSVAILDEQFAVGVLAGTTADDIAAALAAALQRWNDLPFTVTVAANVVTLTAKNTGAVGNTFVPLWNPNFGESLPPGIGVEVNTVTPGVGIINIDSALPVLACHFDCIGTGFEDEHAVDSILQVIRSNWRCTVQGDFKGGHLFHSRTDSAGMIYAYGMDRNEPAESVIPVRTGYKYPGFLLVAAMASRVCCTACYDPSRPVQYDNGVLGCLFDTGHCTTLWTTAEKRMFFDAGIVNWDIANTRGVRSTALWAEEIFTTYKWDPATGSPDGAWQRVEYRYSVVKFVRDLGFWYRRHYSSTSLVNDGFSIPAGKRAVSPSLMQAAIISWMLGTQLGWTAETYNVPIERMVRVQRENQPNSCDPNRLSVMIDLDLVNQLARIATSLDVSPEFACIPPAVATAV